jgi:hypothetical protein
MNIVVNQLTTTTIINASIDPVGRPLALTILRGDGNCGGPFTAAPARMAGAMMSNICSWRCARQAAGIV